MLGNLQGSLGKRSWLRMNRISLRLTPFHERFSTFMAIGSSCARRVYRRLPVFARTSRSSGAIHEAANG